MCLTFDRLVGDRAAFARLAWGRRPWQHHSGLDHDGLRALLDVHAVETMLDTTARIPFVRLVRADRTIAAEEYLMRTRAAGEVLDDVVDPAAVHRAFADGATIVLQGLQRTWHPLVTTALSLEHELGHPVQVNAYLTPADAAGLGRHADQHDVFVLQVSGTKHWWVDGLGELTLEPGDALYLPVGVLHDARTGARHSLHLTIGVPRITYREVMRRWVDTLDLPALDAPLPIGHHAGTPLHGELASRFASLSSAAHSVATDPACIGRVAEREARRQRERRRPLLGGRVADIAEPPALDAGTVLHRRAGVRIEVDDRPDADGRCVVRSGSTTLRMPWAVHAAMVDVRDAPAVTARSLAPLSEPSALVLLRRLVREGLLVPG